MSRGRGAGRPGLPPLVAVASGLAVAVAALLLSPAEGREGAVAGEVVGIHEPSLLVFSTAYGRQVELYGSGDLVSVYASTAEEPFGYLSRAFTGRQAWWSAYSPDLHVWSPDISRHGDTYYLYHAVSRPGSGSSAIGLATIAYDGSPYFPDSREVYSTDAADDHVAADPTLFVDDDGTWWLAFGTDRTGIKLMRLDPTTGLRHPTDTTLHSLAAPDPTTGGGIQSPSLIRHGDHYYLFASYGTCDDPTQNPVDLTCHIRVGRATHPTGPYLDANGTNLMNGGGTTLLTTNDRYTAPGGQSVYGDSTLLYTYYDAEENGVRKLAFQRLDFSGGWPTLSGTPSAAPPTH